MNLPNYDTRMCEPPDEPLITCRCGDEGVPGEGCPGCGEYLLDADDIADIKADQEFERMRQGDW